MTKTAYRSRIAAAGAALLVAAAAQAQTADEGLVVTATRVPTPGANLGAAVTVITEEDLRERQSATLGEVLREVPGVAVNSSGGAGTLTEVRIRGTEANQVVVLIDGIEVNDPALGSQFDFGDMSAANIERIEVVRGPVSTLYGGDAVGGVIQIFTKQGTAPLRGQVTGEIGSRMTRRVSANAGFTYEWVDFTIAPHLVTTEGISIADAENGNPENDGFRDHGFTAILNVNPIEQLEISGVWRQNDSTSELDTGFVPPFNASDSAALQKRLRRHWKVEGKLTLFEGLWENIASYQLGRTNLRSFNAMRVETFGNEGTKRKLEYQTNLYPWDWLTVTAGIDRERETVSQTAFPALKRTADIDGYYGQVQVMPLDGLHLTGGFRRDEHEVFGTQDSWRINGAYRVEEWGTKVRGGFGTAFKSPTIAELFTANPAFGLVANPNLGPEFSRSWEVGVDQRLWDDRAELGVTYFSQDIFDLIQNTGSFPNITPRNVGRAEIQGVETTLSVTPIDTVEVTASHTWLDHQSLNTDTRLIRRPKHSAALNVAWRPIEGLTLNVNGEYRGLTLDTNFTTGRREELDPNLEFDLAATYDLHENLSVFGRVENVTNEQNQELVDFGVPGRGFFIGMTARFPGQ